MIRLNRYLNPSVIGICVGLFAVISFAAFLLFSRASFWDIWKIVVGNWSFWAIVVISITAGFIQKIRNPLEFMWVELPIQVVTTTTIIFVLFSLFYSTSTDLVDKEIWNSYITKAEYHEAWTERVAYECHCRDTGCTTCGTGSSRHKCGCTRTCDTCYRNDYHPPAWSYIINGEGSSNCEKVNYGEIARLFGNEQKTILHHSGQVSIGDGNMYSVSYTRKQGTLIPASTEHSCVNYLKASFSIKKKTGIKNKYAKLLREYPGIHEGSFGNIEFNRVINVGVNADAKWLRGLDRRLDEDLSLLGSRKQVNIIVYLVNTADQNVVQAIRENWIDGKKNDVIVVIGSTSFPKVDWVQVVAWTKSELFKVTLRDRIYDSKSIADYNSLAEIISSQVGKSNQAGGFQRMSMEELEYLTADISLPWWEQLLIVLIGGLVTWLVSWALINNDLSNNFRRTRRRFFNEY